MKYYYFNFLKPQYFFPEGFSNHIYFLNFYKPYSLLGKITWFCFSNFKLYKFFFLVKNLNTYVPNEKIIRLLGGNPLLTYNTGTIGPEQKITGIGYENETYFFFKYSDKKEPKLNLKNEWIQLNEIANLKLSPNVIDYYEDFDQVLLKTDLFLGNKLDNNDLNEKILNCLYDLSNLPSKKLINENDKLMVFSHGDFCPWNLIEMDNEIKIFDWEFAGYYPLGYDLFSYIFQTNFLLNKRRSIELIFIKNKKVIFEYFNYFGVINWEDYLLDFCNLKIKSETKKSDSILLYRYQQLFNIVKNKKIK